MIKKIFFVVFLLSFSLILVTPAQAKIISSEEPIIISEEEVIDDDLFVAGETVTVNGTVNGDLYVGSGTVTINGKISGDVLAAGGILDISGTIEDDLRLAGGNIKIQKASIGDNLTVFGGYIDIDEETTVGGTLIFGSGLFSSKATVSRNVIGGAGTVTLNGPVGKDVRIGSDAITIGPKTTIAGDLVYTSSQEIQLPESATISGAIRQILPKEKVIEKEVEEEKKEIVGRGFKIGFKIWSYFAALVVGILMLYLFDKPSQQIVDGLEKNLLASFGWGLLILILSLPTLVLLMITGIGLPLALILGALFLIDLYLAKIIISFALGRKVEAVIFKQKINPYLSLTLGLAVYYLLASLPIVKPLVILFTLVLGLGALIRYKKDHLLKS